MSKVCGGGSWTCSDSDCEAGLDASAAEVLKDRVSAMVEDVMTDSCVFDATRFDGDGEM